MKKLIALMLGLVMVFSLSTTAFAAGEQTGTTTLTAEVPEPSYTIHIPADTTLEYGNTSEQEIGSAYVSDVVNVNGNVVCNVTASALKNGSNYITVEYLWKNTQQSSWNTKTVTGEIENLFGDAFFIFNSGTYRTHLFAAKVDNWSAEPGTYTATLTFNFFISE